MKALKIISNLTNKLADVSNVFAKCYIRVRALLCLQFLSPPLQPASSSAYLALAFTLEIMNLSL